MEKIKNWIQTHDIILVGIVVFVFFLLFITIPDTPDNSSDKTIYVCPDGSQVYDSSECASSNINALQKVLEGTNVYRFRNLKGYDLTLEQTNSTSHIGYENIKEAYNILIKDNCGVPPPNNYFMLFDTGTFLVIDADTYEIKCDILNLQDAETGRAIPQDEIDAFLTKRENEKNLLDENQDSQTSTPAVEEKSDKATIGEKNALDTALSYLRYSSFSYSGLIEQLEFEGYTHEEAVYGADNCGADWDEQAALTAQSYLDYSAFSREGLIEQLEFEGFTKEQAEYGVQAVGY